MPQVLATALVPVFSNFFLAIGASGLAFGAAVGAIALGASYLLIGGAILLASNLFGGQQQGQNPAAPKPEDGKYNLKAAVPPLVYVLGWNKKAGDYSFLEERGGTAYHITVWAGHSIRGFIQHWLHDEPASVDGAGTVVSPGHFGGRVNIQTRLGLNASTAYAHIVGTFPEIWGGDHRGDGLATVAMTVASASAEDLQKAFPSGMPQHSAEGWGHDRLVDPRTGAAGYSENLAIFRYWHLTHPVGGKLTRADMYDPDWARAANVCDQTVFNRTGGAEPRYHGGMWFRANNDPVQIGRLMDQAAELVIYERPDGLVGVHAGEYVEPDVRLTANDLVSVGFDPNKRRGTNVLAVRGRYTDPAKGFNTADAAIYGIPYPSDDERTKGVENQAVQRHNHISRLQKIAYIRANAPRVRLVAHYEPAKKVPYRRFIRVHYPPRMTEAVVEITGRPTLSLRNLTYEFEGIIIPGAALYLFNAATEEGRPGENVTPVQRQDVPAPTGLNVVIKTETVAGGQQASYAEASVNLQNASFQYELQYQQGTDGPLQSIMGESGQLVQRTGYLATGTQYRFRMRTWSAGTSSNWTGWVMRTITGDTTPPAVPTDLVANLSGTEFQITWRTPNSANFAASRLWRAEGATAVFADAADITGQIFSGPTQDIMVGDSPADGTWRYWVTAENAGGYRSAPSGPVTVTKP